MTFGPESAPRAPDDTRRWQHWVEDQLKLLRSSRGVLERGSVSGGVVTVREILTGPNDTFEFVNTDQATYAGTGDMVIQLTYVPDTPSLQVKQNGLDLEPSEWTLINNFVIIAAGAIVMRAGDRFTAYYEHHKVGATAVAVAQPVGVLVDWGSAGPNLTVPEGNMVDYSAGTLDNPAWATASGPVGHPLGLNGGTPSWPPVVVDTGSTNAGLWLRRQFATVAACTLTITARVDGQWWLYCDGAVVSSGPTAAGDFQRGPFTVPVAAGAHVVALHVNDDVADPGADYLYGDVRVEVV